MRSSNLRLKLKIILPLYLPWVLSTLVQYYASLSYLIAWLGSFYIFYLTILSPLRFFSTDLPIAQQLMRPAVLIQLLFAGFMCCTSIFYFLDQIHQDPFNTDGQISTTAECQRLLVLGHAAMLTGIKLMIKRDILQHPLVSHNDTLLFKLAIISYAAGLSTNLEPMFAQLKQPLINIAISCSAYLLVQGLRHWRLLHLLFGGLIFGLQLFNATLTGYKESIIVNVVLIFFFAFPFFKKTVILLLIPTFYLLFHILPTFTTVIRTQSWLAGKSIETARENAYQTFFDDTKDTQISKNNHEFLTYRLSEIGMFRQYINKVPEQRHYYGLQIFRNAFYSLIPRGLWPDKPSTEVIAMERVYDCGVVSRSSSVSAKTRPVVDGYLSAGTLGVFLYLLSYGLTTQHICNKAEQLFGGYKMGCMIMFNSIFQPLWRGNTLEFLLNNVLYGYLLLYVIYLILRKAI